MTSIGTFIYFTLFTLLFSGGCISIGYILFGKILDKLSHRSEYIALGGKTIAVNSMSEFSIENIERIPAPNLQTFESLMVTVDTLNSCLEELIENPNSNKPTKTLNELTKEDKNNESATV